MISSIDEAGRLQHDTFSRTTVVVCVIACMLESLVGGTASSLRAQSITERTDHEGGGRRSNNVCIDSSFALALVETELLFAKHCDGNDLMLMLDSLIRCSEDPGVILQRARYAEMMQDYIHALALYDIIRGSPYYGSKPTAKHAIDSLVICLQELLRNKETRTHGGSPPVSDTLSTYLSNMHYVRSMLLRGCGRIDSALAEVRQALDYRPGNCQAAVLAVVLHVENGQDVEALLQLYQTNDGGRCRDALMVALPVVLRRIRERR